MATMPTKKEEMKVPSSSPSITTARKISSLTLCVFTYLFVGIAFFGSLVSVVIPKLDRDKQISISEVSLAFWIGIAVAISATQKSKSGWLWFLIGFFGIGFGTVFVLLIILPFIKAFV